MNFQHKKIQPEWWIFPSTEEIKRTQSDFILIININVKFGSYSMIDIKPFSYSYMFFHL